MKLEKIIEAYHPFKGSRWTCLYSGCKSSNNGIRQYIKTTLSKKELDFVLNTRPTRKNFPSGVIQYIYIAE